MKKVTEWTVNVGDATIGSSLSVRNIGATFDSTFKMETDIVNMKRACYIQLRGLHKIRRYLTSEAAEKLTFVTSRLESLNSLLVRIPAYQIAKLQLIQNLAARIVTEQRRSRPSSKIFTGYLLLLVLISKFVYRSISVYMELPRTISLPNFRSMLAPSPT